MKKSKIIHREIVRGKSLYTNSVESTLTPSIIQKRESKYLRSTYKILIVNDRTPVLENISNILLTKCLMTNVDIALGGNDGFNKSCLKDYDLILSAYRMDTFDGHKLYRMLNEIEYKGDFVLISGFNDYEKTVLHKAGIKILDKSFNSDTLQEAVLDLYGEMLMKRIINEKP